MAPAPGALGLEGPVGPLESPKAPAAAPPPLGTSWVGAVPSLSALMPPFMRLWHSQRKAPAPEVFAESLDSCRLPTWEFHSPTFSGVFPISQALGTLEAEVLGVPQATSA